MNRTVTHNIRPIGKTFLHEGYKYHIIGHFMDHESKMFVYLTKYWGKHEQWWHYKAVTAEEYDMWLDSGLLRED